VARDNSHSDAVSWSLAARANSDDTQSPGQVFQPEQRRSSESKSQRARGGGSRGAPQDTAAGGGEVRLRSTGGRGLLDDGRASARLEICRGVTQARPLQGEAWIWAAGQRLQWTDVARGDRTGKGSLELIKSTG
jgi:hypothetical protein